jgi:hypothetical protein
MIYITVYQKKSRERISPGMCGKDRKSVFDFRSPIKPRFFPLFEWSRETSALLSNPLKFTID